MENVEGFEVNVLGGTVYLRFTDLFGQGEEYNFTVSEAWKMLGMLAAALANQGGEDRSSIQLTAG